LQIAVCITFLGATAAAQSAGDPLKACEKSTADFSAWIKCGIDNLVTQAAQKASQRQPSKQVEVPSIGENTTSLVDQTSAPDIAGLALNLAGLRSNSSASDNGTAGTITTSAYALYAGVVQHDPLDPAFYQSHPNLRRFSFSVGHDGGDSKLITKGPATLLGFKTVIINGREVAKNQKRLAAISDALWNTGAVNASIRRKLRDYLFNELAPLLKDCQDPDAQNVTKSDFINGCLGNQKLADTIARLTSRHRQDIADIIIKEGSLDNPDASPLVQLRQTAAEVVGRIRRAPQLSFSFQSKLRNGIGDDEYRTGFLFDYGVWDRFNLSLNGTFDYVNSRTIGGDTRAGRFAAEGIFQLTPNKSSLGDPRPWLLSTSAEAKWPNDHKNTYTGQVKLTIPIPGLTGVNFPISVSVANRSDLIKEKTVRGKFGFTVDITKLLSKAP